MTLAIILFVVAAALLAGFGLVQHTLRRLWWGSPSWPPPASWLIRKQRDQRADLRTMRGRK